MFKFNIKKINVPLIIKLCLVIFGYVFIQKCLMHFNLYTSFDDLFFKDHSIWNITQGRGLFLNDIDHHLSYFGLHFYPFFYLLAPLYFIKATPIWLFLFQATLTTLLAYPILAIAKEKFQKKGLICTFILLLGYFCFRKHASLNIYGETLFATTISWMIYFWEKEKDPYALVLALLLPFMKENCVVLLAPIGTYYIFIKKQYKTGIALIFYGIVSSAFLIKFFIPYFRKDSLYFYTQHFSSFGGTISEQIKTMLFQPWQVIKTILAPEKILYIFLLFAPLGFLAFLSPYILLSFGMLLQNLIANNASMFAIWGHYAIAFIPIVFIPSILVLHKLKNKWPKSTYKKRLKTFQSVVIFFLIINLLAFIFLELRKFIPDQHIFDAHRLLNKIPATASISTTDDLFVHLHYRDSIYRFPYIMKADYILLETSYPFSYNTKIEEELKTMWQSGQKLNVLYYLIKGQKNLNPKSYSAWQSLQNNKNYELIDQGIAVYLYKRK